MNSNRIIKSIRAKRNLTQDNVAEMLNISRQAYNNYENDLKNCSLKMVMKILSILNANEDEISEFFSALEQDYLSYCVKIII